MQIAFGTTLVVHICRLGHTFGQHVIIERVAYAELKGPIEDVSLKSYQRILM